MQNEIDDLHTYVSTHSHTDIDSDALEEQKTQLETWLVENTTYIGSLESQMARVQEIAYLTRQPALIVISQNQMSHQSFVNAYNFNRVSPEPFYEQLFTVLIIDNSSIVLGS